MKTTALSALVIHCLSPDLTYSTTPIKTDVGMDEQMNE